MFAPLTIPFIDIAAIFRLVSGAQSNAAPSAPAHKFRISRPTTTSVPFGKISFSDNSTVGFVDVVPMIEIPGRDF